MRRAVSPFHGCHLNLAPKESAYSVTAIIVALFNSCREHGAVLDGLLLDVHLERRSPGRGAEHGKGVFHDVEHANARGLIRLALCVDEHDARNARDLAAFLVEDVADFELHVFNFDGLVDEIGDTEFGIVHSIIDALRRLAVTVRLDAAKSRSGFGGKHRGHGSDCGSLFSHFFCPFT